MSGTITSNTGQVATRTNLKTQSGNRVIVEFGGQAVGLIQSARLSDSYALEDASGIGDIHVIEHVPSKATHSVAVSAMVLFVGSLRAVGAIPENGDATLLGLVFDFVSYSRDTGQALRKYISCSYDSGDSDISAHRIVMTSGTFKALDVQGTNL